MNHRRTLRVVLCGVILAGCTPPPSPPQPPTPEYVASIEDFRARRVERLKTSWLMIAGLYWLEPGDNPFGSAPQNKVVFPDGAAPEYAGKFVYTDGSVMLEPADGVPFSIDGQPVGPMPLTTGSDAEQVTLGRLTFWVIERAGRHAVRLRDPEFSALRDFRGIEFYPIGAASAVEGRLEPYDEPRSVNIETVIGYDAEMFSLGRVEFELGGESLSLEALVDSLEDESLFIIFKDATSGKQTYGAGRYLSAPIDGENVKLDFNKAYNPHCAFTPHATCPLPPSGNTLGVAVEAGERAYHLD